MKILMIRTSQIQTDKKTINAHVQIRNFTYGHRWEVPLETSHRWPDRNARICQPTHSPRRNGR